MWSTRETKHRSVHVHQLNSIFQTYRINNNSKGYDLIFKKLSLALNQKCLLQTMLSLMRGGKRGVSKPSAGYTHWPVTAMTGI